MDIAKLTKTLTKEFQRSPGKSLALVALLPVALYFIVPLVLPKGKSKPKSQQAQAASFVAAPTSTEAGTESAGGILDWQAIAQLRSQDPLAKPAVFAADLRNPFYTKVEVPEEPPVEETRPKPPVDPEPASYVLSKTLISSRVRIATINRKRYRLNELIKLTADEAANELKPFRLIKIEPRSVTLARDEGGKPYVLEQRKSR